MMRTRLHLKPGQKGTKQLLTQYGDRLVCVCYRYDAQRKKRFKTVEIIVAEPAIPAHDWYISSTTTGADSGRGLRPCLPFLGATFVMALPRVSGGKPGHLGMQASLAPGGSVCGGWGVSRRRTRVT